MRIARMNPLRRPGKQDVPPMSIGFLVYFGAMMLLGLYFTYMAVQGPSGILRRAQLEAETETLMKERDRLNEETEKLRNLTHRLSDQYLDLDLLDERAREVLGYLRADEIVIR